MLLTLLECMHSLHKLFKQLDWWKETQLRSFVSCLHFSINHFFESCKFQSNEITIARAKFLVKLDHRISNSRPNATHSTRRSLKIKERLGVAQLVVWCSEKGCNRAARCQWWNVILHRWISSNMLLFKSPGVSVVASVGTRTLPDRN